MATKRASMPEQTEVPVDAYPEAPGRPLAVAQAPEASARITIHQEEQPE